MTLLKEQFVGKWQNTKRDITVDLRADGSAETQLGKDIYRSTWQFFPTKQLLIRVVIPLNDPTLDDELNAHEMALVIRHFSANRFTAEEFDMDGVPQVFARII